MKQWFLISFGSAPSSSDKWNGPSAYTCSGVWLMYLLKPLMDSWDHDPRKQYVASATTRQDLSCQVQMGMGTQGPIIHPSAAHLWQILHWEMACVERASIWDAHLSQPRCIHSFVTHTFLICQISHSELPTLLWVKSKHGRQSSGSVPGATSFWSLPGLLFPTQFRWLILHMEPTLSFKIQIPSGHSLYCLYPPMAPLCLL